MKSKTKGDWENKQIGHAIEYYQIRDTFFDATGPLEISPSSNWGFFNAVITSSHNTTPGHFGEIVLRPVIVHDRVWVTTGCILYNCEIGEGAILAAGSVVRSRNVPAWTMVEGNPAKVIARYDHGKKVWVYQEPEELRRCK